MTPLITRGENSDFFFRTGRLRYLCNAQKRPKWRRFAREAKRVWALHLSAAICECLVEAYKDFLSQHRVYFAEEGSDIHPQGKYLKCLQNHSPSTESG